MYIYDVSKNATMQERLSKKIKDVFKEDGKIFIGMCHPWLYGPVRGINAILTTCEDEKLDKFLTSEKHEILRIKFWEKTQMAAGLMILPAELIKDCEVKPKEFSALDDLLDHLEKGIKDAVPLDKDPFYYRLGII